MRKYVNPEKVTQTTKNAIKQKYRKASFFKFVFSRDSVNREISSFHTIKKTASKFGHIKEF